MKRKTVLSVFLFLAITMALFGCKAAEKEPAAEIQEEFADTGALVVESTPGLAEVYLGEEYRGDTPLSLYNLPVGKYEITIKKQGYTDSKQTATIKVGRTEEIDAALTPAAVQGTKPKTEEQPKEADKPAEKLPQDTPTQSKQNKISLSTFAMYYDFDKMEFTELRTDGSDLFSRKYDTYIYFTILAPTMINALEKPINEVAKEDCIFASTGVAQLFSGQTLCVKTGAGNVVAIGGAWQGMPTEIEYVQFS